MQHHRHHIHYAHLILKNKELREMYAATSLKTLALSMVGIFIPLFLMLEQGLDLQHVLTFYVVNTVTYILAAPFAGKLASKFGLKRLAIITAPMFAIFYYGLYNFVTLGISINYFAILLGLAESFYWIPFVTHFIRSSDKKHRSEEVGFLSGTTLLSAMLGPFIGGLLITLFDFTMLFIVASILLLLSVFPILFTKNYHEPFKCSLKDLSKLSKKGAVKMMSIGGVNIVEFVFWPIFLFAALGVYAEMGLIFLIAEFAAIVGSFLFGSVENRGRLRMILRIGGVLCALTWFSRMWIEGVLLLALLTIISSFLHEMVTVPFNTLAFDNVVKKKYLSEYVVFRGFMTGIGRLIVLGAVTVFLNVKASFVISGLMYLTYLI